MTALTSCERFEKTFASEDPACADQFAEVREHLCDANLTTCAAVPE